MAPKISTPPILIADGNQKRIAVRHSEEQTAARCVEDAASDEPEGNAVFLSFCEVIGWIAYRRLTALEGAIPEAAAFFERWRVQAKVGTFPTRQQCDLVYDLRRAIARVRMWRKIKRHHGAASHQISPVESKSRARVRWAILNRGRTADATLRLLYADIKALRAARQARDMAITGAVTPLIAEIAAGAIIALGRPGDWRAHTFKTALHEAIPSAFFANAHNTIRLDGWATWADSLPMEEWVKWTGPSWGDVRFRRSEVLSLWPPERAAFPSVNRVAAVPSSGIEAARPKFTTRSVTNWCRDRLQNWPKHLPPPTEAADWAAASLYFDQEMMSRDEFRVIRNSNVPKEWRTQGRRLPWGEILGRTSNEEKKSAKLRNCGPQN